MLNKLIIIIGVLLLAACGTTAPIIQTVVQRVEVPIAIPCKAVIPDTPVFNFDSLDVSQDIFDKSKALLADRKLYQGYSTELLAALKSCE